MQDLVFDDLFPFLMTYCFLGIDGSSDSVSGTNTFTSDSDPNLPTSPGHTSAPSYHTTVSASTNPGISSSGLGTDAGGHNTQLYGSTDHKTVDGSDGYGTSLALTDGTRNPLADTTQQPNWIARVSYQ